MAASSPSVDPHHAAHISSDNTTVALVSYNVGILNSEVKSKGWAEKGEKRQKLMSDVEKIFKNEHGIQIALISEMGNMLDKLSHSSGGSHPTAEGIFEGIIADLNLKHIQVKANTPYVALLDTTYWRAKTCELIGNLCDKKDLVIQQLILEHVETNASILCFNAHMPTSLATAHRKKTCVLKMCTIATEDNSSGVTQPTASMPWLIAGDLNITKGTMMQWCQPYVQPNVDCISDSGWPDDMDAQKADFALPPPKELLSST